MEYTRVEIEPGAINYVETRDLESSGVGLGWFVNLQVSGCINPKIYPSIGLIESKSSTV